MIYLIHENKDINEITLIYYIKPNEDMFYKEILEKDLPIEKEGYHRKLFYDKINDKVYAEYEEIKNEETDPVELKNRLDRIEENSAQAIIELTEMLIESQL